MGILSSIMMFFNIYNRVEPIRIRIIPNSNSKEDIETKMYLKNILEQYVIKDIDINNINDYLEDINTLVYESIGEDYKLEYGDNYFPRKMYDNKIYKSGYYESLVITLGKGEGDNWWCMLYPNICFEDYNTEDLKYDFYIKRIFNFKNNILN